MLARSVLVVGDMAEQDKDPNQGEGDKLSARRYDNHVREFIADGKVEPAAEQARSYVERHPDDAEKSEAKARRGPGHRFAALDELLAKGQSVIDRVRPLVRRATARVRARLSK